MKSQERFLDVGIAFDTPMGMEKLSACE